MRAGTARNIELGATRLSATLFAGASGFAVLHALAGFAAEAMLGAAITSAFAYLVT